MAGTVSHDFRCERNEFTERHERSLDMFLLYIFRFKSSLHKVLYNTGTVPVPTTYSSKGLEQHKQVLLPPHGEVWDNNLSALSIPGVHSVHTGIGGAQDNHGSEPASHSGAQEQTWV